MSDAIKAARAEYAALLGDGVAPYVPAKLGPGGFVQPGDPYIERGDSFGSHRIRLDGVLLFRAVNNETVATDVDDAIEARLVALADAQWNVTAVSTPRSVQQDGEQAKYLGVAITATKPIHL